MKGSPKSLIGTFLSLALVLCTLVIRMACKSTHPQKNNATIGTAREEVFIGVKYKRSSGIKGVEEARSLVGSNEWANTSKSPE